MKKELPKGLTVNLITIVLIVVVFNITEYLLSDVNNILHLSISTLASIAVGVTCIYVAVKQKKITKEEGHRNLMFLLSIFIYIFNKNLLADLNLKIVDGKGFNAALIGLLNLLVPVIFAFLWGYFVLRRKCNCKKID